MAAEFSAESNDTLREQLSAVERGGGGGARISRSADRFGRGYATVMAALIAGYLLVIVYVYSLNIVWLDVLVTAAFVVSIVAASLSYGRRRSASSRGWAKRYSLGFALSVGLFGLGIGLADVTDSRALWLWLPYALVTALPLLAVGLLRGAR